MNQLRRTLTSLAIIASFLLVLSPMPSVSADHDESEACDSTHNLNLQSGLYTGFAPVNDGDVDIWRHYAGSIDQNFEIHSAGVGRLEISVWTEYPPTGNCMNSPNYNCAVYAGTPCIIRGFGAPTYDNPYMWLQIECADCFGSVDYQILHFHSTTVP